MIGLLFNIIIVAMFICFLYKLLNDLKGYGLTLLLQVFFVIWLVSSVTYIETGIYNRNLDTITYFNFSTLRLLIYEFIFFATILVLARITNIKNYKYTVREVNVNKNILCLSNIIILIINMLFITNAIISGNVLTNSNISRFNFYKSYSKIALARPLFYIINPLSCVVGLNFIYSKTYKNKFFSVINLLLSLTYAFLTGNEFGVLLYILFYFFLPIGIYFINSINDTKQWIKEVFIKNKKIILLLGLIFMAVILVKINSFNKVNVFSDITTSPVGAFIYRALGLQGDTWWGTDRLVLSGYNDINQLVNEVNALFDDSMKNEVGIQYLMKLILPQVSLNRYIWGGAELMSGYPAINIVMYGYIGAAFVVIIESSMFFLLTSYVYKKIIRKQYLRVFLSVALLDQSMKVFGIGGIWYLGNIIPITCIVMILMIEFINITIGNKIVKYK